MAVKTYVVQKGDTLYGIAKNNGTTVAAIAKLNDIADPNFIVEKQPLQIPVGTSTTPPPATPPEPNMTKAVVNVFGLQTNTDRTIYASWKWDRDDGATKEYETKWYYDSGDGMWFMGSESTVKHKQAIYNAPSNAKRVRFVVRPIAESTGSQWSSKVPWTAEWSDEKIYNFTDNPPTTPSFSDSNVKIEGHNLTVELENLNVNGTAIEFEVVRDNTKVYATKTVNIVMGRVAHTFTIAVGSDYKVRCRACRGKIYSAWSDYSGNKATMPSAPAGITECKATSRTSVYLAWTPSLTAKTYDIEYTTKKSYFGSSDGTTTVNGIKDAYYEKTGLEMGQEYFFRVRAVNDGGESSWSEIASAILGKKPVAPTTWSSATTVMTGEPLTLYWVHNAEDGSSQKYAELELYINDVRQEPMVITNSADEDEKDKTSSYSIDTSEYTEGTTLQWRVRTSGITNEFGDWSIQRTVDIYAPATLELSMLDSANNAINVLTSLPFYISGLAGPNTQRPIGYHVSIISNEMYETTDNVGNAKIVNVGNEVYSRYFDISDRLNVQITAKDISLENNMSYTINGSVSMNSGLVAESSRTFTVTWDTVSYKPDVSISIDPEALTATIHPYCEKRNVVFYKVDSTASGYSVTTDTIATSNLTHVYTETGERVYLRTSSYGLTYYCIKNLVNGDTLVPTYYTVTKSGDLYSASSVAISSNGIAKVYTTDGKEVLLGATLDNTEVYYCSVIESELLEDVMLSVYRRDFDGGFTEIVKDVDNAPNLNITDPHPALDYARYRVVATSETTGNVSYYDAPGYPVGGKAAVIQWDEDWMHYEAENGDALAVGPWKGSILKLPYNIDISNSHKPDVALVKYIGREHPVSYYGPQLGHTSTWKMDIERSDKETIHAIRRLANWKGDVYVREPSGSGYWAHVTVSFDDNHCEVIIPLSLDITRVEGGV